MKIKLENIKVQRLRQELKVKKEQIKLMDLEIAEAEAQLSDNRN